MIQVMLLTLEMERRTSWELELGSYYALKLHLELVKAFRNYLSLLDVCRVEHEIFVLLLRRILMKLWRSSFFLYI